MQARREFDLEQITFKPTGLLDQDLLPEGLPLAI